MEVTLRSKERMGSRIRTRLHARGEGAMVEVSDTCAGSQGAFLFFFFYIFGRFYSLNLLLLG